MRGTDVAYTTPDVFAKTHLFTTMHWLAVSKYMKNSEETKYSNTQNTVTQYDLRLHDEQKLTDLLLF